MRRRWTASTSAASKSSTTTASSTCPKACPGNSTGNCKRSGSPASNCASARLTRSVRAETREKEERIKVKGERSKAEENATPEIDFLLLPFSLSSFSRTFALPPHGEHPVAVGLRDESRLAQPLGDSVRHISPAGGFVGRAG